MKENGTPSAAADIRAMAELAEAEAAEAEALAAAARARARAIQLRREAQQLETTEADAAPTDEPQADEPPSESEPQAAPIQEIATDRDADDSVVNHKLATSDAVTESATATSAGYRRRRPKLSITAGLIAVLVVIAALASSAWMVLQHRSATERHRLEAEFAAAARQGVVTLTSLDFNNAKAGVQRILDDSTGSFRDDFAKMADDFTKVVEESKVVEQGSVQAVAVDVDSMTKNSAVALVASTSEVTNAAGAKQDPRTFRLIVTLTRDGDQLKMSKVEFVP